MIANHDQQGIQDSGLKGSEYQLLSARVDKFYSTLLDAYSRKSSFGSYKTMDGGVVISTYRLFTGMSSSAMSPAGGVVFCR